jgi:peptide deformylase
MTEIILAPNKILSETAKEVDKVDSLVLKVVADMKKALDSASDPIGVGLAAPQIGKALRIFIAKPTRNSKHIVFINPKIISKSSNVVLPYIKNSKKIEAKKPRKSKDKLLEGCLSLKDIWGEVARPKEITVSYLDEEGKSHKKDLKGFMAVIVQHEIDHLDGILFTKRVLEQNGKLYQSHKDKKGEDIFEEIDLP